MRTASDVRVAIYLPNCAGGGVERVYLELLHSLLQKKFSVDLVIAHLAGPYVDEIPAGVRVINLNVTHKLNIVLKLARYLRREKPSVLLSGGDISNVLAVLASIVAKRRKQCVIGQRAMVRMGWELQKPRTWRLKLFFIKRLYKQANLIICNSEAARRELIHDLGMSLEKCNVIYNSINVDQIQQLALCSPNDEWFIKEASPVVISIGSLSVLKDMMTLIRAFSIARMTCDCRLLILGEGPERKPLEALIRAYNLEHYVHMPGFLVNPFPLLKRSNVFVSASLTEGCPNVILQALACNTPIVATNCPGGTSEILEDGRWGQLVPVGNASAMAAAIVKALREDKLYDLRERLEQFTPEKITSLYLKLLEPNLCMD